MSAATTMPLSPDISALPGQAIEVRCLAGDVDSNGRVNAVDRALVVGAWTSPAGYSAATDLNLDGRSNAPDVSNVVGAWTGVGTNCAP